ncbi:putative phage tail protein [Vallitalea sp.]|jgi:hypothetical protein|uniref:putative phage tail protein n=1 Tax=Vallitalea sp. TaxID=1882829 RepID=UPI0025F19AF3|nr:putative phage tail protein [Vallitalea sp.]MCT4686092.1 YmfQ family protein [Vallitalea sp.]
MSNIKDYWIEQLKDIKEFDLIASIEDKETFDLKQNITDLIDDQFIQTATEKGIARRETMLKITPFANDNIEDRRFRVLSRWNDKLPYTYSVLINRLDQLCGEDGYKIELNNNDYILEIGIELTKKRMFDEVRLMTRRICPANIMITVKLRYNQYLTVSKCTHLKLSLITHKNIREEAL